MSDSRERLYKTKDKGPVLQLGRNRRCTYEPNPAPQRKAKVKVKMRKRIAIATALAASIASQMAFAKETSIGHVWKTYTNVRFEYHICYPADLLVPQGEAENSDGQSFLAQDGAKLSVYGSYGAMFQSLKDELAETSSRLAGPSGTVTYKVLKAHWFVVSGQNGPTIFYVKTIYNRDALKSFELTYDRSDAAIYEPLINHLSSCFADLAH